MWTRKAYLWWWRWLEAFINLLSAMSTCRHSRTRDRTASIIFAVFCRCASIRQYVSKVWPSHTAARRRTNDGGNGMASNRALHFVPLMFAFSWAQKIAVDAITIHSALRTYFHFHEMLNYRFRCLSTSPSNVIIICILRIFFSLLFAAHIRRRMHN